MTINAMQKNKAEKIGEIERGRIILSRMARGISLRM